MCHHFILHVYLWKLRLKNWTRWSRTVHVVNLVQMCVVKCSEFGNFPFVMSSFCVFFGTMTRLQPSNKYLLKMAVFHGHQKSHQGVFTQLHWVHGVVKCFFFLRMKSPKHQSTATSDTRHK